MKVLLVVPRLVPGGACRSTIDLARAAGAQFPLQFSILSLAQADPQLVQQVSAAGLEVVPNQDAETVTRALAHADIVHLGFWNTPEVYGWLKAPLPARRLVITYHINGAFPSQVITQSVLEMADWNIIATTRTRDLPVVQRARATRPERFCIIPSAARMVDVESERAQNHRVRVGYVGTVDFVKMHPRYVEMCAAVNLPDVTFCVAGSGDGFKTLARQAQARGIEHQFELRGYLTHPNPYLATLDIFGYPLCRETYATTDLVVQQAMWQGVPPVILPYGGVTDLVQHRETGMIVAPEAYAETLRELVLNEPLRARLGAHARAYAREHFGADKHAVSLHTVYERAMQFDKDTRAWHSEISASRFAGADAFMESIGGFAAPYRDSANGDDAMKIRAAEKHIANALPGESGFGGGGFLDYRRAYPQDALLRLWSGLVLGQAGRYALAAAEFAAARAFGLDAARVEPYLQRVAEHLPPFEQAQEAKHSQ